MVTIIITLIILVVPFITFPVNNIQFSSFVLEKFCENICLCNRILSQQHVAKNQIRQNLCDLLQRQNSVAETKIFTKFPQYTRSDLQLRLSPRNVATTSHQTCTHRVICRRDLLLQLVAQCVPTLTDGSCMEMYSPSKLTSGTIEDSMFFHSTLFSCRNSFLLLSSSATTNN